MRKIFIMLAVMLGSASLFGQSLQLTAFSGYTFGDKFYINGGRGRLGDGHTYGGIFTIGFRDFNEIEIEYRRQDAMAMATSTVDNLYVSEPVSVNYILAGANRKFPLNEKVNFFSGGKIGAGIFASKENAFSSITKFSVSFSAGMRYFLAPKIAIRLQGNVAIPIINTGGNLWWSPGSGTHVGLSAWSPITQFGFTGGLVFVLK